MGEEVEAVEEAGDVFDGDADGVGVVATGRILAEMVDPCDGGLVIETVNGVLMDDETGVAAEDECGLGDGDLLIFVA